MNGTEPRDNGRRRRVLLVVLAVAGLAGLAADRLVLTPFVEAYRARSQRITLLENQVRKGETLLAQQQQWTRRREDMEAKLLPTEPSEAEDMLLRHLDKWALTSGLTVTALQPRWKPDTEGLTVIEVRVAATGALRELVRFMYALETAPVAIAVDHFDLSSREQDGRTLSLTMRVTGLCSVKRANGTATNGASAVRTGEAG